MKTHTTLFDKLMTAVTFAEAGMVDTAMTFDRTPEKRTSKEAIKKGMSLRVKDVRPCSISAN